MSGHIVKNYAILYYMPKKVTTRTSKRSTSSRTTESTSEHVATSSTIRTSRSTSSRGGSYTLLIVESPSKAKTISKYLGSEYRVIASVGHVRDLPKSNKGAIDIEHGYIPKYIVSPGKQKVIQDIKELATYASTIILATDPDREGEAIAWHVKEAAGLHGSLRVTFNEITKDAIIEALTHPRHIDDNLRKAQEARRVLDRLVGYELSGLIWKKVRYGLSAGRVQSPALRIVMEREREIRAFIPQQYFVLSAELRTGTHTLTLECVEKPQTEVRADEIRTKGLASDWIVGAIEETEVKRSPKAPFTTSTLQQTASTRLGYSPSRTMMVAQKLYEAGHITYMRTDSTTLSQTAIAESRKVITSIYGANYTEERQFKTKSKNAQEAHEAIRPTHLSLEIAGANDDEKKLYRLIRNRTLASQMSDARIGRTKITAHALVTGTQNRDAAVPDFTITGSRVIYDGWLRADPDSVGEDVLLPVLAHATSLTLLNLNSLEKFTEPPSRYTEAGLIKELEKRGIGRPSTYASIIRTLEERAYVEKVNKSLIPTDTGDVVSSFLEEHFSNYISDTFTAHMEDRLDEVAIGTAEYTSTIDEVYKPLHSDIQAKESLDKATTLGDADAKFVCPICGRPMVIKLGRTGKFLSCSTYPECTGSLTLDGTEIKADEPIGTDPATGLQIFVKIGRFGPYVQLGEKDKKLNPKPKMASIPKEKDMTTLTVDDALHYLSLPRVLGNHPTSGKPISANKGRFGPYVVHDGDFRSLKTDDVYEVTFERALEIFSEPKKVGRGGWAKKKAA
jgi:DNA topoisomerase I